MRHIENKVLEEICKRYMDVSSNFTNKNIEANFDLIEVLRERKDWKGLAALFRSATSMTITWKTLQQYHKRNIGSISPTSNLQEFFKKTIDEQINIETMRYVGEAILTASINRRTKTSGIESHIQKNQSYMPEKIGVLSERDVVLCEYRFASKDIHSFEMDSAIQVHSEPSMVKSISVTKRDLDEVDSDKSMDPMVSESKNMKERRINIFAKEITKRKSIPRTGEILDLSGMPSIDDG